MSVVVSLLRAIDRADGEALVMHVGEKPYVVTAQGHAELASNALTVSAMTGMLEQLLPADSRQALNELGAVEYQLPPDVAAPGIRYSVVAARGGDDIWIEVRRRREVEEPVAVAVGHSSAVAVEELPPPVPQAPAMPRMDDYAPAPLVMDEPEPMPVDEPEPAPVPDPEPIGYVEPEPPPFFEPAPLAYAEPGHGQPGATQPAAEPTYERAATPEPVSPFELKNQTEEDFYVANAVDDVVAEEPARLDEPAPSLDFTMEPEVAPPPVAAVPPPVMTQAAAPAAPVVQFRPAPQGDPLHHLLKVAAAQGASALYVAPKAKPSLRVDGEMRVLDEAAITDEQLETGLRSLTAAGAGAGGELPLGEFETRELTGVGRVQCLVFRDHRGLGAIFRMLPGRTVSSEQSGLSAGIQSLCTEPEGLLLVAGAPGAGKSTLVAALVDQINRTRRDHVITVETDIQFVHENRTSFVSQREAREDGQFLETVRSALRESPDVLVIDGVMNAEIAAAALQAAGGGLVVASVTAPTTSAALDRFVSFFGNDAASARAMVSEHLRGVVTQALLRKTGGGRAAAREVLVNVPSVASLVAHAQFDQLPGVLNSGRRIGMVPLNDALLGLVQSGALDVRQAFRKSPDQNELIGMLNQAGFDTTFAERLS